MGHISIFFLFLLFLLFFWFCFFEEANEQCVPQMSVSLLFLFVLFCAEEEGRSQELVLTEMHPLDDVTTIIEHAANILRIDGAGEVRIAIMFAIARGRRNAQELVADEVLGTNHLCPAKKINQLSCFEIN